MIESSMSRPPIDHTYARRVLGGLTEIKHRRVIDSISVDKYYLAHNQCGSRPSRGCQTLADAWQ